jgi:hypothetical protein
VKNVLPRHTHRNLGPDNIVLFLLSTLSSPTYILIEIGGSYVCMGRRGFLCLYRDINVRHRPAVGYTGILIISSQGRFPLKACFL